MTSRALSRTVKWTATDDTGVKSYDVRSRSAPFNAGTYGGYSTFENATTATSAVFTGQVGRTYCVSVRARDYQGNLGAYGPESCITFPVDERTMVAAGKWLKLELGELLPVDGAELRPRRRDAQALGSLRRFSVIATKCPSCGTGEGVPRLSAPQKRVPFRGCAGLYDGHTDRRLPRPSNRERSHSGNRQRVTR